MVLLLRGFLAEIPGALRISQEKSTTYKSGARSPVYVDNRLLMGYPDKREVVTGLFRQKLEAVIGSKNVDSLSGVAKGRISYASILGVELRLPVGYVDQGGTKHKPSPCFAGVLSPGDRIVVIEDHTTTGGSIIDDIKVLRAKGAIVEWALCISTYNFKKVEARLAKEGVKLVALCDLLAILNACARIGSITKEEHAVAVRWYREQG